MDNNNNNTQPHYQSKDGTSLYHFADNWYLNPYELDICKRIVRCRHKGNFAEDLKKTKDLIDIYLKEYKDSEELEDYSTKHVK